MAMPESPEQGQEAPGATPAQIAAEIYSGMEQLGQMMAQSKDIPDEDKQAFAQIIAAYKDFIENKLGGGEEARPQQSGPAPMESGGNPNAIPMRQ